jgi:hypothetical protein
VESTHHGDLWANKNLTDFDKLNMSPLSRLGIGAGLPGWSSQTLIRVRMMKREANKGLVSFRAPVVDLAFFPSHSSSLCIGMDGEIVRGMSHADQRYATLSPF